MVDHVTAINWDGDLSALSMPELTARRDALAFAIANAMHRFGVDPRCLSTPTPARFGLGQWPTGERAPLLELYGEVSDELDRRARSRVDPITGALPPNRTA
jgi:hypothetical protein